jgi:predicted metal-binding membrane protein
MSVLQMSGMNMGTETALGPFSHFLPLWVTMMAAMMLPGAAVPLLSNGQARMVPTFLLSYLGIWTAIGVLAYLAYQPHGNVAAGAVVIAAGGYELTPLKRRCRRRCRASDESGLVFGIACLGSTVGLMAVLLAISPMSLFWMAGIAAVAIAEKILPATVPVEPFLALALLACGTWILLAPSSVPGLMSPM